MKFLLSYKFTYLVLIIANLLVLFCKQYFFKGKDEYFFQKIVWWSPWVIINLLLFIKMIKRKLTYKFFVMEEFVTYCRIGMLFYLTPSFGLIIFLSPIFESFWLPLWELINFFDKHSITKGSLFIIYFTLLILFLILEIRYLKLLRKNSNLLAAK